MSKAKTTTTKAAAVKLTEKQAESFALLREMATPVRQGLDAMERAQAKLDGGYTYGIQAAAMYQTWDEFDKVWSHFESCIQRNTYGMAKSFRAEERDKATKDGKKYKVPTNLQTVKSRIKAAFRENVSLRDESGEVRSYHSIVEELAAIAEAKRQATGNNAESSNATAEASAPSESNESEPQGELTADDKVRNDMVEAWNEIYNHARNDLSGASLAELAQRVFDLRDELTGSVGESLDDAAEAEPESEAQAA